MKGMIKKDLLMGKNNYKSILFTLVIFIFYSIMFEMNMLFFLPIMGLIVCISTLNYDEYNNWHAYATTLPQGKINVVKSKYITTIGIIVFFTLLSIILSFIIGSDGGTLELGDYLVFILEELVMIIFMMSLLFPVLFKYNLEKGRIAMIIIVLGIYGIISFFKNMFSIEITTNMIIFLDSYFPTIFVILSLFSLPISYYISKRIYLHREF